MHTPHTSQKQKQKAMDTPHTTGWLAIQLAPFWAQIVVASCMILVRRLSDAQHAPSNPVGKKVQLATPTLLMFLVRYNICTTLVYHPRIKTLLQPGTWPTG